MSPRSAVHDNEPARAGLTRGQRFAKRAFDVAVAFLGLLLTGWLIVVAWGLARLEFGTGFFRQVRIGRGGRPFRIVKIQTMRPSLSAGSTVTVRGDPRITPLGALLRRTKVDELPQLLNVLVGDMSFVGPRPDVPGFADQLAGRERLILSVRPGMTGPATLQFRDEERLLAGQPDPERHNREVLYPEKTRLNLQYVERYSFAEDIRCIWSTIVGR